MKKIKYFYTPDETFPEIEIRDTRTFRFGIIIDL